MRTPELELLWWAGCPSTERALAELREAIEDVGIEDVGIDDAEVRVWEIGTGDAARAASFVGSPTILIDGVDLAPVALDEPAGLNCRLYRRRDGKISPTPDPEDLREALRRAASRAEVSR